MNAILPTCDWLLRCNAIEMARNIENYWHNQGYYKVRVWVEAFSYRKSAQKEKWGSVNYVSCIRPNLVNGNPPL